MSFTSAEFCDTNVFVYAHDVEAGSKREQAQRLVARLALSGDGALSVQVLQEFFVTVTRKLRQPLHPNEAREIVSDLVSWRVFAPSAPDVLEAIDNAARWQLSFWDAMLVTAANRAGATVLWSEDLSDGQAYGVTTVRNPFV